MLLQRVRKRYPDNDVLVFSSDMFAAGALLYCQRMKIDVPGQLAIIGFGDYEISQEVGSGVDDGGGTNNTPWKGGPTNHSAPIARRKVRPAKVDMGFRFVARQSA